MAGKRYQLGCRITYMGILLASVLPCEYLNGI